ncbi:Acyl-CoA synthetase (AMP-forming)/AMP-acid ligase II [Actinacidiphila alni]|uniref:Acyl-CoA synthetase (AMP-forming)/AMP-acid ligase II n=1 Tax=Actinacidiphila alni TaxID=380248 RepID=A0A1I2B998_9ACTN|nr:SDR family NAD(P)-dependent oxidoreductase [Actinacidiphila alni]SFE52711.1 Acyl-CoA synthetase (AMP-forming)/AMP-acid ligase II [Actinacidiphila alni]
MPAPLEFPASFDQERMWFFHRLDPGNPTYNVPLVLRLRGALDAGALGRALDRVVARHEILRTTYAAGPGGSLSQFVHEDAAVPLEVSALEGPPPAEPATADPRVAASLREVIRAPFDLMAGPPVRARLLWLADDDHLLVFCLHHIATDGWSLGLLVSELDAYYRAEISGARAELPELPIQYADYAEWQRTTLTPEVLEERLAHWRDVLGDRPPRITLPTDRPRPARPSFNGARVDFDLPPDTARAVRDLAARYGVTLHMTLLAAWNALLHRYGAGERIVVGTLLANRDNDQLAPLMGLFVNTLPVRVDVAGESSFAELLARTRTASMDVLAHQDTPVDGIVRTLGGGSGGRDGGGNPLFQVLFALQNFADQRLELGGLDVERIDDEEESTRFDLELHVWEHPDRLHGSLVHDTDLFDAATARRIVAHFRNLLTAAVRDPKAPLDTLPLRSEEDERALRARIRAAGPLLVLDRAGRVPPEGVAGQVYAADSTADPAQDGTPTGERGLVRADGSVRVLNAVGPDGRVPDVVRIGEVTVRPAEIEERLLLAAPALADVAVVPRLAADAPDGGAPELLAYVVPSGPVDPDALGALLPVPGSVLPVSRLPLTPSGEVDVPELLRLPVADREEARRLEARLRDAHPDTRIAVLPTEAVPTPLARVPVPAPERPDGTHESGGGDALVRHGSDSARVAKPEGESDADERPAALVDGGPAPVIADRTLVDTLLRAAGTATGDLVLLREDGGETRLTYAELHDRALRALTGLRELGLDAGDRVILQLEDHTDFVTVLWACLLGGQVAVPLAVPADYRVRDAAGERLRGAWELLGKPLVVTAGGRLAELREAAAEDWPGLRTAGADAIGAAAVPAEPHPAQPDDPILLMLTSGSTGRPKAVVLRHRNVLSRCAATTAVNGLRRDDVSVNWLPLDHVGGVVMFHLRDVFLGCRQVHAPTRWVLQDPLRWLDLAHRFRATTTWAPNFAFGLVDDRAADLERRGADWDLSPLRFVMNAGEAIVARVARRWLRLLAPYGLPGTAMRPAWGMSETSSAMVYSDRFTLTTTADEDAFVEVGAPLPGCALRIVDGPDAEPRVLRESDIGRLQVRGATVTTGYDAAPEQNAAAFTPDGWFDTGDLGRVEGGRLTLTGRAKDVVILNGVNYHSHEIESVVDELACVEPSFTAAVAVRTAAATTDELAVFFHPRDGADRDDAIRTVRRAVLDRIGVNPRHVLAVEPSDIPKTEIGKIQRTAIRARFEAGGFTASGPDPDDGTVPDHFHRPVWVPRALTTASAPAGGAVLILADTEGVAKRLARTLEAAGRRCVLVKDGDAATATGTDGPTLAARTTADTGGPHGGVVGAQAASRSDVQASGHARSQATGAATAHDRPTTVVDLRAYGGGVAIAPDAARAELHALLGLFGDSADATAVYVVTSHAVSVGPDDPVAYERAPVAGLVATLGHERDGARVVQVDVPPGDADSVAALLAGEVARLPRDTVVAHRDGRRLVRRLAPAAPARRAVSFVPGGRYLVTGGTGGIGRLLAGVLAREYGARVLCLGRTARAEPDDPRIAYAVADVRDADAVGGALRAAEQEWGAPLDGVLHLAGSYREAPLAACTAAELDEALDAKVGGARVLHSLLRDRPGLLFVSFSSVNGFFGGASVAGYAAASAFLDALAVHQRQATGLDAYSLAWSMWDETGMSAGHPLKQLTRARGYRVLPPDEALASLTVALERDAPHQLIGLDPARPWIAAHLAEPARALRELTVHAEAETAAGETVVDRFGTPTAVRPAVLGTLPLDPATGEVDRARLAAGAGAQATASDAEPRAGLEEVIAAAWTEVLGVRDVTRESSFFDLGGGSLQATRVHGLLQERLGRDLPMVELFRRPTVRALAEALEPAGTAAPAAGGRGRSRAERRLKAAARTRGH